MRVVIDMVGVGSAVEVTVKRGALIRSRSSPTIARIVISVLSRRDKIAEPCAIAIALNLAELSTFEYPDAPSSSIFTSFRAESSSRRGDIFSRSP